MYFSRYIAACVVCLLIQLAFASPARADVVWESTFDSSADGVEDVYDNNENKVMIGPAAGGRLEINAADTSSNPDKVGRPLGMTLGANDSMSGQYKFSWSELNEVETQAYEVVGFLGTNFGTGSSRQVLGSILRHWKFGADYYVAVDVLAGGWGATSPAYLAGPVSYWLGTNPTANDYEFRIEYDGTTHLLNLELLDGQGTFLTGNSLDLDLTPVAGGGEFASMAFTHLGWSDYYGNLQEQSTVWQVDSLAFYDDLIPDPPAADADYNDDGQTDAADYVAWRKNFGASGAPGTVIGDGTSNDLLGVPDGDVDLFDYDFWKSKFGTPASGGATSFASAVPEPGSVLLAFTAGLCLLSMRRGGKAMIR